MTTVRHFLRPATLIIAFGLGLGACAWPMTHHSARASAEDVAAARSSRPGPLPSAPGVCKAVIGSPVCCVGGSGGTPATGTCVASADACRATGGTVADSALSGCA